MILLQSINLQLKRVFKLVFKQINEKLLTVNFKTTDYKLLKQND